MWKKKKKSYVGLSKSPVLLSYDGDNISYVGRIISFVGGNKSYMYVGDIIRGPY